MKVLIDGINYELDSTTRTASVWALDEGEYSGDIVIPAKITYDNTLYHVTSIYGQFMGGAFYDCRGLTSITIPDSVTSIGDRAFYCCDSLTSITIPNGVTSIGILAFGDCIGLTSITIPESVTSIGARAFYGCSSNLTSIIVEQGNQNYDNRDNCNAIIETATNTLIVGCRNTIIPDSVMSIRDEAFKGCSSLTAITIPNSVTSIGESAFYGCSSLTSLTIPDCVTSIGEGAFDDVLNIVYFGTATGAPWGARCMDGYVDDGYLVYADSTMIVLLTCSSVATGSITIPNSVMSIGDSAFRCCRGLSAITIPNSVTYIGNNAFYDCSSLTSIEIPDSVMSVGEYAFCGCSSLTSITIPDSVTSIGENDFWNCSSLTSIIIPNSVTSIGDYAFQNCSGLTSIVIPDSVTSIGEGAFSGCSGLTSIIIPDSVMSVGEYAFCGCSSLTSITIPDSVTSIGDYAFYYCGSLTSIAIPNSVTSIRNGTFMECESLTSITIPNSVTSIGESAFEGCRDLTFITIPDSVTVIGDRAFSVCALISITVPDSVTSIGNRAFMDSALTSIIIPNGVTSIRDSCFADCDSLTSIALPDSVTHIGCKAFENCKGLASITIFDGVTNIGKQAFLGCKALRNITLPKGSATIAFNTFGGCRNLKSITIHHQITTIENQAFFNCGLTSIIIPKETIEIGKEYVFAWCDLVTMVVDKGNPIYDSRNNCNAIIETHTNTLIYGCQSTVIPNGITRIEKTAFYGCWRLKTIAIPNSVEFIGQYAFAKCSRLSTITIPNSVNAIGKSAFKDCALQTIRIPKGKQSIFNKDDLEELQDKFVEYISAQVDGVQYELDDNLTAIVCADEESYKGSVVIPARVEQEGKKYTVNRLAARAFADCEELTSVTLPKSITEIGAEVFSGRENLQAIRVPLGMTEQFCEMGLEPWRDKIVEPRQEEYTILLNIARGYEQGIGMPRNPAQAVLLYSQAADKGCADAAYHLGELYEEGLLLPQDYQQAADWFGKAAALYHPNGATRRQACLRIIEEENARLAEMQQEQQAQLDRLAQTQTTNNKHTPMKTILFFDTETNGLPRDYKAGVTSTSNWPRMIQLGWIITDEEGNVLKQESRLIYPDFVINEAVTRLTGITTDQARREGVDISEVLPEFMADVENASLLVGHNIDFDRHIVGCEMVRMHSDPRTLMTKPAVCTMQRSTNFCAIPSKSSYHTGYKYPTLTELYTKLFGHAFSGAHDALADITATKECYFELCKRGVIRNA